MSIPAPQKQRQPVRELSRHPAANLQMGSFQIAAVALAPILLEVDFGHLGNSQHQVASNGSRRIEEVKHRAVSEPAAVRERVEATGPGPLVCVDRQAGADANPADLNVTIEHAPALSASIRIAAAQEHDAIRAYSSPASGLVNLKARMSVSSMRLRGAIDPHGFAAVARTVIGHAGGTPRWRRDLATLTTECRRLIQT
jgi:hypothetical protein